MRHRTWLLGLGVAVAVGAPIACSGDESSTNNGGAGGTTEGGAGQGGTAQGGTAQGGTAQGGNAQGGNGQAGEGQAGAPQGGNGQGGAEAAAAECTGPGQCTLIDDCCTCAALPSDGPAPPCDIQECDQSACAALGYAAEGVSCEVHQCVAGFNCDESQTICDQMPPVCDDPTWTASVDGTCWGPCVPADECQYVSSCERCAAPDLVCVSTTVGPLER